VPYLIATLWDGEAIGIRLSLRSRFPPGMILVYFLWPYLAESMAKLCHPARIRSGTSQGSKMGPATDVPMPSTWLNIVNRL
jgi:hypothetical protein